MGTSLIASAPPTTARSISPSAMASAALVIACRLVAQARTTEHASTFFGSPLAPPTSRGAFRSWPRVTAVPQVVPGVDPGGVAIAPLDLHRIAAHLVHALRLHVLLHLLFPHHALAAPLLHALRARASRAQPARRELRVPAVVPADEQVAVGVERQIGGLRLRRLRFDLVEQAHAQGSTASGIHRPCSARRSCSRPSRCPTRCSPGIRSGSGTARGWRSSCPPERDTSSI